MKNKLHDNYFGRELIIFLVIVALAVLFWSSAELQKLFSDFILFAGQYLEQHLFTGIIIFWAVSALSAILSPFSSIPLVPVAAVIWGGIPTTFFLLLGWLSGAVVSYFLGSFTGHILIKKIFPVKKAEYYRQEISARANFLIVLLFRLAMPTEIAGYVLGTIKYNLVKYLIATAIAEIPFAFIVVYSGEAFMEANKDRFVFFVFLALTLISVTFYIFKKLQKNKPGNSGSF